MTYNTAIQSLARDYARLRLKRTQTQDLIAIQPEIASEDPSDEPPPDKRNDAWFYPDIPWGVLTAWFPPAPPSWDVTTRGKMFLRCWDVVTFLACVYVAVMVPYISGFTDAKQESTCVFVNLDSGYDIAVVTCDLIVDAIFFADIVVGFTQARWQVSSIGRPHWILVDDLRDIRKLYLKGNFATDLVGQIPWQYIDCIFVSASSGLKFLRLLRLIKLLRLYRIRRVIQALYFKYPQSVFLVTFLDLFLTMSLVAHWMCCLWFRVGYPDGWTAEQGIGQSGTTLQDGEPGDEWFYEWITSFYWSVTTMTTIGYGDISAGTAEERMLSVCVMVVGCGFFAWVTGKTTKLLTEQHASVMRFKDKMEDIKAFMVANDIPKAVKEQVLSYYMLKFPTMQIFDEYALVEDLPDALQKVVIRELFVDVIPLVPLFASCDKETQFEICRRLTRHYKMQGFDITYENTESDGLYIVRFGMVSVMVEGHEVYCAKKGDMIGENAVFGLTGSNRRDRSSKAKTDCELFHLRKEDVSWLLKHNRAFRVNLRKMLNLHIQNLKKYVAEDARRSSPEDATARQFNMQQRFCVDWQKVGTQMQQERDMLIERSKRQGQTANPTHGPGGLVLKTTILLQLKSIVPGAWLHTPPMSAFVCISWHGPGAVSLSVDGGGGSDGGKAKNGDGHGGGGLQFGGSSGHLGSDSEPEPVEVKDFSYVFPWTPDSTGAIRIAESVAVTLAHKDNRWDDLPPLKISLFASFSRPPPRNHTDSHPVPEALIQHGLQSPDFARDSASPMGGTVRGWEFTRSASEAALKARAPSPDHHRLHHRAMAAPEEADSVPPHRSGRGERRGRGEAEGVQFSRRAETLPRPRHARQQRSGEAARGVAVSGTGFGAAEEGRRGETEGGETADGAAGVQSRGMRWDGGGGAEEREELRGALRSDREFGQSGEWGQSFRMIAAGKVPLLYAVRNRVGRKEGERKARKQGSGRGGVRFAEGAGERGAAGGGREEAKRLGCTLDGCGGFEGSSAEIVFRSRVQRRVRPGSLWRQMLWVLRNSTVTSFHQERNRGAVYRMERGAYALLASVKQPTEAMDVFRRLIAAAPPATPKRFRQRAKSEATGLDGGLLRALFASEGDARAPAGEEAPPMPRRAVSDVGGVAAVEGDAAELEEGARRAWRGKGNAAMAHSEAMHRRGAGRWEGGGRGGESGGEGEGRREVELAWLGAVMEALGRVQAQVMLTRREVAELRAVGGGVGGGEEGSGGVHRTRGAGMEGLLRESGGGGGVQQKVREHERGQWGDASEEEGLGGGRASELWEVKKEVLLLREEMRLQSVEHRRSIEALTKVITRQLSGSAAPARAFGETGREWRPPPPPSSLNGSRGASHGGGLARPAVPEAEAIPDSPCEASHLSLDGVGEILWASPAAHPLPGRPAINLQGQA